MTLIVPVAQYVDAGNFSSTGTPKTVSVTVANGDDLIIIVSQSDYQQIPNTPTGGGLTYTSIVGINENISNLLNSVHIWKAHSNSAQTFTMSIGINPDNGLDWGFIVLRFSGVLAVGAEADAQDSSGNTAPSVSLTTIANDSAIVMVVSNFNQMSNTRVYLQTGLTSFTESEFVSNSSFGAIVVGYYLEAGSSGAYTIGMTGGATTWAWICVGIELKTTLPTVVIKQKSVQSRAALVNAFTT